MKPLLFVWMLSLSILLNAATPASDLVISNRIHTGDSLFIHFSDVLVNGQLRDQAVLAESPVSYSEISGQKLDRLQACNLKSMAVYVPNIYVPDYGSSLTSAIYIRGIGTRLNTSAVGFYLDNVPFLDKSGFDFDWQDIDRVEVLRGPQATLYGRNSTGGLIHIHSRSPFENPGTQLRLSFGSYNDINLRIAHNALINNNLAFSVSAAVSQLDGFVKNVYTDSPSGSKQSADLKGRLAYRSANGLKSDITLLYDKVNQDGYPYAPYSTGDRVVSYNAPSTYDRDLVNVGWVTEKALDRLTLSAVTGYQWLSDDMHMDQDFSDYDVFTLNQRQKIQAATQEFILKSDVNDSWEWVNGLFGFYSNTKIEAPVSFGTYGVAMMESGINSTFPSSMDMTLDLTDDQLYIPSTFTDQKEGIALYHQSTWHVPFLKGLSLIAGLRYDWEWNQLDYLSSASMGVAYNINYPPMSITDTYTAEALLQDNASQAFSQLIPKLALQYEFLNRNKVYLTVSKGYQAGGYNIQLFSDFVEQELEADMMDKMKMSVAENLQPYVQMGMPQSAVDAIVGYFPDGEHVSGVGESVAYKPEVSWNYEAGFHLEAFTGKLQLDGAAFYINTKNRQIAQFVPSGLGRVMKNASGSISRGVELSVLTNPLHGLTLNASYGFTDAYFTAYKDSVSTDAGYVEVDYSGKKVPMVPAHTFSAGAQYGFDLDGGLVDRVMLGVQYHGTGRIYWTEANTISQPFYGLTDVQVSFFKKKFQLDAWAKNLLNTNYDAFYFESMHQGFAQQGKPLQLGLTLHYSF